MEDGGREGGRCEHKVTAVQTEQEVLVYHVPYYRVKHDAGTCTPASPTEQREKSFVHQRVALSYQQLCFSAWTSAL